MTKCIVIGENKKKDLKPIEIEAYLDSFLNIISNSNCIHSAKDFAYAELICRSYNVIEDIMFFYNDPNKRNEGILVIGKWNDGIV